MKTVAQIKEAILALCNRVQAIAAIAKEEKRDYTAEEASEIDAINGVGESKGKIDALTVELDRATKQEDMEKRMAAMTGAKVIEGKQTDGTGRPKMQIPSSVKMKVSTSKAFRGAHAAREAHVTAKFVAAKFFGDRKAKLWLKENVRQAAVSVGDNQSGGLFVPNETTNAIIRLVEEYGVIRRYSKIEPMMSSTKTVPVRVSGVTAHPVAETNTANEGSNSGTKSQAEYTNIELVARKWKTWFKMSDEFSEDSAVSIAEQFVLEAALAFATAEDDAGFNGTGAATYHGIIGIMNAMAAGSIYTALAGNTAFSTLDDADFRGMKAKLRRYAGMQPAWFISPEGYSDSIERLQLAAGGNTSQNLSEGGLPKYLGYPVVEVNALNGTLTAQTSTNLLCLGDLRMATVFGDRRKMTLSTTDQRYWDEDQMAIKATERFDFNCHSTGTASEAGAVVVLATPGA